MRLSAQPCHRQESLHDDLIDVPVANLELTLCSPDDSEALSLVGGESGRIVGAHLREQLLVALARATVNAAAKSRAATPRRRFAAST